jgi:lambda repressor-like predicted transcriptional regulator
MGTRPSDEHSLDRKNVDGDYTPLNCRWATIEEQNNNKTSNTYYFINGVKLTLGQISKRYGIHRATLETRLKSGWSIDRLIEGRRIAQTHCHKGEEKTILEWAVIYRIPYATLKVRLDNGIPFEIAVIASEKKTYTHCGVEKSLRRLAREFDMSPTGLASRLRRGLSLEEALTEKKWIKK